MNNNRPTEEDAIYKISKKFNLPYCRSSRSIFNYVDKRGERIIQQVQLGTRDNPPKPDKGKLLETYRMMDSGGIYHCYFEIAEVISENSYKTVQLITYEDVGIEY